MIVNTLVLWLFFIATAKIAGSADSLSELSLPKKIFVISFVLFDVAYNYTLGTILFLDLPSFDKGKKTLTSRLKHYLRTQPESWRGKLSWFMCKYMIEPWDYGHCQL